MLNDTPAHVQLDEDQPYTLSTELSGLAGVQVTHIACGVAHTVVACRAHGGVGWVAAMGSNLEGQCGAPLRPAVAADNNRRSLPSKPIETAVCACQSCAAV